MTLVFFPLYSIPLDLQNSTNDVKLKLSKSPIASYFPSSIVFRGGLIHEPFLLCSLSEVFSFLTLFNGSPLAVAAPNFVVLKIVETDPGVRGDTSGGGGKPAKLETGAVVRVPLFVPEGELIKVDTRTGEYVSRVKE